MGMPVRELTKGETSRLQSPLSRVDYRWRHEADISTRPQDSVCCSLPLHGTRRVTNIYCCHLPSLTSSVRECHLLSRARCEKVDPSWEIGFGGGSVYLDSSQVVQVCCRPFWLWPRITGVQVTQSGECSVGPRYITRTIPAKSSNLAMDGQQLNAYLCPREDFSV